MIAHAETYRFSVEEYNRLGKVGFFDEDDRVELLNGEIIIMAPLGKRHAQAVRRLGRRFNRLFGDVALVDYQNPLILDDFSEPQPDILLLDPAIDEGGELPRPHDVYLVVEVADSTFRYDSRTKLSAYARAGIREYWIVNLADNTLEVFRQPQGETYAGTLRFSRGEKVAPAAFPECLVEVGEIIPL
jgi:Uma2 family endonuclease